MGSPRSAFEVAEGEITHLAGEKGMRETLRCVQGRPVDQRLEGPDREEAREVGVRGAAIWIAFLRVDNAASRRTGLQPREPQVP
jgi:hypothetical protein